MNTDSTLRKDAGVLTADYADIHGRSRPRQAGRRLELGVIKLTTAPAKTIRILTHPARVTPPSGQKLSNLKQPRTTPNTRMLTSPDRKSTRLNSSHLGI